MKQSTLYFAKNAIFPILFNLLFFMLGGTGHPISVWISYAFIHIAYLMTVLTPLLAGRSKNASVFGASLSVISTGYFLVELVLGLVFILIGSDSYKAALILQLLLAGVYAAALLSNLQTDTHTAEAQAKQDADMAWLKTTANRVHALIPTVSDPKAQKAVGRVYDLLRSSPVKAANGTSGADEDILTEVAALEISVRNDDTQQILQAAQRVANQISRRNSAR